ncbi:MAG: alpha-2-macroglobulin [Bacteroidia bacterium]
MRSLIPVTSLGVFCCLILMLASCKKGPDKLPEYNPASSAFVNAFTTGEISKASTIRVHFTEKVADTSSVGEAVSAKLFSFTPKIKGEAVWEDGHTLAFKPETALPSGKVYAANVELKKLFPKQQLAKKPFSFHFKTRPQNFAVEWTGNESGGLGTTKWQNVRGVLVANDKENPADLQKLVQATYKGKAKKIAWQEAGSNKFSFVVEKLERGDKSEDLILNVKGSALGAQNFTKKVAIPSKSVFACTRVLASNGSDQYITLEFSDPVDPKQRLEGLISVGDNRFTTSVTGNRIVLYPSKRIVGNVDVKVKKGIKAYSGKKTVNPSAETVTMDSPKPKVELVNKGTILPQSKKSPFLFKTVGLTSIDVRVIKVFEDNIPQFLQVNRLDGDRQMVRVGRIVAEKTINLAKNKALNLKDWNTHSLDLSELMDAEPGALYQVALGYKIGYYIDKCEEEEISEYQRRNMPSSMLDMPGNWDDGSGMPENSFWNYYYDYNRWEDREDPCKQAYYRNERAVRQNLLASDLGIIVKRGDMGEALVVVTDLKTAKPVSGAKVELLNYQQQVMADGSTNGDGFWKINLPKKPFLLSVKHNGQSGYLRLDDGSSLSFSRFNVSGKTYTKGLKGYMYGERGVWRPGDPIHLTFILQDKEQTLPANHPVTFTLKNPDGQEVDRKVANSGLDGFYTFETGTDADAKTGSYTATIEVGGATFSKQLKIETVMPNRLKIAIDVGESGLKESEGSQNIDLEATWLHGAKAGNLKAKVQASLRPRRTSFDSYSGFTFDDPSKNFSPDEETFFDGTLNSDGKASFPLKMNANQEAAGMLNANFVTRVFEQGGAASVDRFSTVFHPYSVYAGVKLPKGDASRGMLLTDTDHDVEIVTVNTDGKPAAGQNVTVELFKVNWRWWWHSGQDNLASYMSRENLNSLQEGTVTTNAKGEAKWQLNVKYPEWGRYLVRVTDEDGHSTGKVVYIDWPGWAGRAQGENPGGASMLVFNADKKNYKVGENVQLTIPSPNGGRALVSLESGNRILRSYWVECQEGGTKFNFQTTDEMAPNIFASVTLLQPHEQTANDLPLRLYGVIPIAVENPKTVLEPVIATADEYRPNSRINVAVSEKGKGPMTYTLAVVDEGLLSLTRFKTPQPHSQFYQREALNIKTWDLFDDVIGAYGGEIQSMLSIGGDGEGAGADGKKQNRFRPVVEFLGPFELKKGKTNEHSITLPNYVGAVRVMVVAGRSDGAYGSVEKEVPVRAPIMLAATLPRVLGPGERARLPINVFAMKDNIKTVNLSLETGGLLKVSGNKNLSVSFSETGEKMAYFEVEALEKLGSGSVKIVASGAGEKAEYATDISVRIANPMEYEVLDHTLADASPWNTRYTPLGMAGTNDATLEVSALPSLNLQKRLRYLIRYPYGCVEQTTSGAFPQLYLSNLTDLSPRQQQRTSDNVKQAIERLKKFQNENGGLSYWPGHNSVNDYSTSYAGHFLLEAKRAGFDVSDDFLKKWRKYQKDAARNWKYESSKREWRQLTQAYRLMVLALDGNAEMGAMNRLRKNKNLKLNSRWLLAGAYYLAGQVETANRMLKDAPIIVVDYRELGYSYGSHRRDQALMLYVSSLGNRTSQGADLLKAVAQNLGSNRWMSTQETSMSLLAVSSFVGKTSDGEVMEYEYKLGDGVWQKVKGDMKISQHQLTADKEMAIAVRTSNGKPLFARIIKEGTPLNSKEEAAERKMKISVAYIDENGQPIANIATLRQGQDFTASVTITHAGEDRRTYQEIALDQIFPSGWEIRNHRLDGSNPGGSKPEYQDIRDDRVYSFFDLPYNTSKTFNIRLNASYQGRYYLPAVSAHTMYDHDIYARTTGQWVEVLPADGQ